VARLFVYRRIGTSPLIVSYGQSLQSVYAGWRQLAWRIGGLAALASVMNIALIIFLARALKRGSNAEHSLANTAMTDGLTGLCNRRRFDEIYDDTWRTAERTGNPVSVLMIDVDTFKAYNDRFGHQAGDDALAAIAHCIQENMQRSGDVAARYGGEEFIVLLADANAPAAVEVGEKIRQSVLEQRARQQGRPDSTPTISLGIASIVPVPGLNAKDLIRAADAALYEAKSKGRNRTEQASMLWLAAPGRSLAAA
jgi:diguanylate cyclase (GGDEF)-like protein